MPAWKGLRLAGAAALMAFAVWLALAAAGFLSDRESTVRPLTSLAK
jgi:hypothetical protein